MIKYLLFFSLLFSSLLNAQQHQYFFSNYTDKIFLERNYDYILVRFAANVSGPEQDRIIYESVGNAAEKKHIMRESYRNGENSVNVIIELKRNQNLGNIENDFLKFREVEYVGMAFQNHDNVVHFTTNEIVVKFRDYVNPFEVSNLNTTYGCNVIERIDLSPAEKNVYLLRANLRGGENSESVFDISNKFSASPFVEYSQPNFIRTGMLLSPNDSLLPWMWHIRNTGNNIPDGIQGIPGCDANVDSAWNITTGNAQVLIAVIDTGVDTNHADLISNLCDRRLWYDAYEEDQTPWDEYGHGTAVGGICCAVGNNHIGTVGVSYSTKQMPVRIFGPAPEAYTTDWIIAKGLNWAWVHGADIFNCSWGGGIPTPLITNGMKNAYRYGRNGKGIVIFAGAGNDNHEPVLYPSSMDEVVSVGGLSPCNQRKSPQSCDIIGGPNQNWGASYGDGLSLVAPCTYIGTTTADGFWCICGNGTSDSSPIGAGVGALILAKNINLSADSVMAIVERSAVKVGNYSYNVPKRHGLWNYEMGYGRIDAKRALDMTPPGPSQIYNQSPPIITFTPPESGILKSAVTVNAKITDDEMVAPGANVPRLYLYTSVNPNTQFIGGVPGQNNNYFFTLPASEYGTRLYYYIAAQDTSSNGNITTYAPGGGGVNPPGTVAPQHRLFLMNTDYSSSVVYSGDVPKIINAERETTVVSLLNNMVSKSILDINCMINIDHARDLDITVSLFSPDGTEFILTGSMGDTGVNYTNTIFDDEAPTSITDTNNRPPYTGRFKPIDKLWLLDGNNSAGEWKLQIVDDIPGAGGILNSWNLEFRYSTINENVIVPDRFALVKNFPNPFNPRTRIVFNVPFTAKIRITVFDILGRQIKTLLDESRPAKLEDYIDFNTLDPSINGGLGLPSGVYFYSLYANGSFIESKRMVLLK